MHRSILTGLAILLAGLAWSRPIHAQTLFSDDFENGAAQWTLGSPWHVENAIDPCGLQLSPFPSGARCLRMGNNTGADCHFHDLDVSPHQASARLDTPIVLVGTGARAWLRYVNRADSEECDDNFQFGFPVDNPERQVSTDGGQTWIGIGYDCRGNRWHKGRANLTPYLGQQILVRCVFSATDAVSNEGFGWLIDDVSVRIEPGAPHCDATNACPCQNYFGAWPRYWEDPLTADIGGCINSALREAELYGSGRASIAQDDAALHVDNMPLGSYAVFVQGSALTAPQQLGDGLTCLGGRLMRLGVKASTLGAASYPGAANRPLSTSAHAGETVAYQVHFRDAAPYCTPKTSNFSNAYTIEWQP
jgi:hypothetical protein